jgi:hypothetical protein
MKSKSSTSNGLRRRTLAVLFAGVVTAGTGIAAGASLAAVSTAAAAATATATATAKIIPTPPALVTPSTWTVGSLPPLKPSLTNQIAAVACATSSFCVAVGNQSNATGTTTLVEQWNGSTWSIVTSPNATGAGQNQLYGVSCAGPSFCVAVGVSGPGGTFVNPLVEQWNGSAWSLGTAATPPSATATELNAVSCTTATWCMAAGYSTNASSARFAVAETWNGTAWTVSPITPPTGALSSQLDGIDCVSASWCMAGGDYENASMDYLSLAMLWNGSTWSVVSSPNPGNGTSGFFDSVSCAGTQFCVAAGFYYNGTVFQAELAMWNGSTWSNVTAPETTPSTYNYLNGVACLSATSCSAVGEAGDTTSSPVALTWNGQTWSIVTAPSPSGSFSSSLSAVTCLTDWQCVAFGAADSLPSQPYVMTAPIARSGYRFVASDGGVFDYGAGAPFLGSMGGQHLNQPIVGMGVMPASDGYYLVASDGGIFSYGSAQFYGSTGSMHLNKPVVGMAVTPDGGGYWLVASDGGIFSYGDAAFYGSTGSLTLNKPIVGMASTPDGKGYYLVASDGGIFSYGDAQFYGSTGSLTLNKPVVGMAVPTSGGYYLVASDGGIFTFPASGGPPFEGSTGSIHLNKPIVGMTTAGGGYYLSGSDGGVFAFPPTNGPPFLGSTGSITLNAPIVGIAS